MKPHRSALMLAAATAGMLMFSSCDKRDDSAKNEEVSPAGISATPSTSDSLSAQDKEFVTTAAQDGRLEVQLGELSQEKASKSTVKAFGQKMVTDHTQANHELSQIAQRKNIEVPTEISSKGEEIKSKLEGLSGEEFDRAYVDAMVQDHEKAVAIFEKQSRSSKDEQLKEFAEKTLPVLKQHLDHARTLASGDRPTQAGEQDPGAGAVEAAAENTEVPTVNAPRSNDTNQLAPPTNMQ